VIRVLTWNLFHGRDGLPGLGPDLGSVLCGRPVDDGVHMHLNRKLTHLMAARIAAWAPDLCALQEVPTAAVRPIAARTGMRPLWTTTGPLIGPTRLRDALAERNPDLWRSHEGNANVLLVGPRLAVVPGSETAVRLNPLGAILRAARAGALSAGELVHYLPEPRKAVMALVETPAGQRLAVSCAHCHGARHPAIGSAEIARAARAVRELGGDGPAVLAGDLNARPGHPGLAALAREGWSGARPSPAIGIDRILARGIEVLEPERAVPAAEREVQATWRGRRRRVRLSDHDPVTATLRASGSPAGPRAAR
jgi:endonuclease/exonuclease/phosphatase family metal-dependent hydrolase